MQQRVPSASGSSSPRAQTRQLQQSLLVGGAGARPAMPASARQIGSASVPQSTPQPVPRTSSLPPQNGFSMLGSASVGNSRPAMPLNSMVGNDPKLLLSSMPQPQNTVSEQSAAPSARKVQAAFDAIAAHTASEMVDIKMMLASQAEAIQKLTASHTELITNLQASAVANSASQELINNLHSSAAATSAAKSAARSASGSDASPKRTSKTFTPGPQDTRAESPDKRLAHVQFASEEEKPLKNLNIKDRFLTAPLLGEQIAKDRMEKNKAKSLKRSSQLKERGEVFPNVANMKARLVEQLRKPAYNVEDLYSETGWAQCMARNEAFQNSVLAVIVMNVIWIAIDTDYNKADVLCNAPMLFQVVNNVFCFVFSAEITIRFVAFKTKADCLGDPWFVFDATLVALMVWETWIEVGLYLVLGSGDGGGGQGMQLIRLFRILRLTRVARLARLMRSMPELTILIKGMVMAMKSVGATLFLLMLIIYVFAILFVQQLAGTEEGEGSFDNVPQAVHTLLLNGVFSEEREFIQKMLDVDWVFYAVTLVYLLLASMTVLNMLIGILCEVIAVTAKVEHEELSMANLEMKLKEFLPWSPDSPDSEEQMVTREDFVGLMANVDALQSFTSQGIDVKALVDCASIVFKEDKQIPMADFIETVLRFRAENQATVKDIMNVNLDFNRVLANFETRMDGKINALGFEAMVLADPMSRHFAEMSKQISGDVGESDAGQSWTRCVTCPDWIAGSV